MILIDQLSKIFSGNKKPALNRISVEIKPGRITGLIGPDGAGKTTLLRLIAGLLEPTSGTVNIFGRDATSETDQIKPFLGYMPQKFGLYEDLTVAENLELYAMLRGLPKSQREERFAELLKFTNLERFTKRLARQLSGGMKQKLGLACALIKMPKLLLLDEPGVGVDPISRRELWRMVRNLLNDDVIVIWSTAYLDEAQACDEVLLLNEGQKLFMGKPQHLTEPMQGRVIQVQGFEEAKRRAKLAQCLKNPHIRDGVLQGGALRLVLDSNENQSLLFSEILQNDSSENACSASDHSANCCSGNSFSENDSSEKTVENRNVSIQSVLPRFEDGFIDILGGISQRESGLAKRFHVIPTIEKPIVVAEGLTKRYGSFVAADHIDFSIRQGEIMGLLGPNGAGKSTTFKMLCGLIRPTEGVGYISGWNLLKASSKARSRLGYMAQKFSLYPDLTVRQNLEFYSGVYGLHGKKRKDSIDNMLELFELGCYEKTNSGLLPLGFKQRLSLAAALMHEPDVLFLDEPTSGVDPLTRREFWGHINALLQKGVTVLVTTHFMDEAEYCDRISLIYNGKKIAEGTPEKLKELVRTPDFSDPTLEDAFIGLIQKVHAEKETKSQTD